MIKKWIVFVVLIGTIGLIGCKAKSNPDAKKTTVESKSNPEAEKAAIESAQAWLEMIDNEKYAESWENAAEYFKTSVNKDKWEETIRPVRAPLGKLISRELKSKEYVTSLPGAPDGQYVIIQFSTKFENKDSAVETITPMLDKDSTWRVSGYFIK